MKRTHEGQPLITATDAVAELLAQDPATWTDAMLTHVVQQLYHQVTLAVQIMDPSQRLSIPACECVLLAMARYPNDALLQREGCAVFSMSKLCRVEYQISDAEAARISRACSAVCAAMRRHPEDAALQRQGCSALQYVCEYSDARQSEWDVMGMGYVVYQAMTHYPLDRVIQVSGLTVFYALYRCAPSIMSAYSVCEQVCTVLRNHPDDADIYEKVIDMICALVDGHTWNRLQLLAQGACALLCEGAKKFPTTGNDTNDILSALLMLIKEDLWITALIEAGMYQFVCELLKGNTSPGWSDRGCQLIAAFAAQGDATRRLLIAVGACEIVCSTFTLFSGEDDDTDVWVQYAALKAMQQLCLVPHQAAARLGALNACQLVWQAVQLDGESLQVMNGEEGAFFSCACEAIVSLCGVSENRVWFQDHDILHRLLDIGEQYGDEDNTLLADVALVEAALNGDEVEDTSHLGEEELCAAARQGQWDTVRNLLAEPEVVDWVNDNTVLCYAIRTGDLSLVQSVLGIHRVREIAEAEQNVALSLVIQAGWLEGMEALLAMPAMVARMQWSCVLHWAVQAGQLAIVERLLTFDAVQAEAKRVDWYMLAAVLRGHWLIVHRLQTCSMALFRRVGMLLESLHVVSAEHVTHAHFLLPYQMQGSSDVCYVTRLEDFYAMIQHPDTIFDIPACLNNLADWRKRQTNNDEWLAVLGGLQHVLERELLQWMAVYRDIDARNQADFDGAVSPSWYSRYVVHKNLLHHPHSQDVIGDFKTVLRRVFLYALDDHPQDALSGLYQGIVALKSESLEQKAPLYIEAFNYLGTLSGERRAVKDVRESIAQFLQQCMQDGLEAALVDATAHTNPVTFFRCSPSPVLHELCWALYSCLAILRAPRQSMQERTLAHGYYPGLVQLEELLMGFYIESAVIEGADDVPAGPSVLIQEP